MYCSSCGVAVTQNRSYCNHCGAKLNRDNSDEPAEVRPEMLVASMVGMFIFGLLAMTVLMGVLKNVLGLPVERVLAVMALPFLLMLILEGVFLRLLLRRTRGDEKKALSNEQITNELDSARARLLSEPMSSVTEHTTRAFEPSYTERKQK